MTDALFPSSLLAPLFSTAEMRAVLDDRARLQRMLDFEAALARAEAAVGIVPAGHAGTIADACDAKRYDLGALGEAAVAAGNLATPLVSALTAEIGKGNAKAAGFVHWGATSQDVIDTAMVLELRAVIDELFKDLDRATKAFTALAGRHRRNMTMARTLLQQALPMPFGLKLAGYAAALARSRDRLRRLRKEALVLQFGGAAGTLAALGEKGLDVSERLAALLDLTVPDGPWHSHRDRFAEIASAFAILAGTCGKIARDVALLMQSEVAEVSETAAPGRGGASTMPQKRNPVGATAALSAAMVAPNLAATILSAQIQEHERAVGGWQAEWVTFPALALTVSGALRAVVGIAEGLVVDVDRMKANLDATGGMVFAEAVSFALAEKLGKAAAHELVAGIARQAVQDKRPFRDQLARNPDIKLHLSAIEIERLFSPNHYQGSSQTFIDRLVASSQGRAVRRSSSVSHLTEPKMPTTRPDHLSAIRAAASAVKATTVAEPAPPSAEKRDVASDAPVPQPAPAMTLPATPTPASAEPPAPVAPPVASVVAKEPPALPKILPMADLPIAEPPIAEPPIAELPITAAPASAAAQEAPPEPVTLPASDAPKLREPDDEPGALLEVFAKIEAFAKAAENENTKSDAAQGERKPA